MCSSDELKVLLVMSRLSHRSQECNSLRAACKHIMLLVKFLSYLMTLLAHIMMRKYVFVDAVSQKNSINNGQKIDIRLNQWCDNHIWNLKFSSFQPENRLRATMARVLSTMFVGK